jgi:hypothetical protein
MENVNQKGTPISGLIFKWFDIAVTAPDQVYSVSYELDKTIAFITGIDFTTNRDKLLYQRGTHRLEINRFEVFPEGFPTKKVYHLPDVESHKRFYRRGDRIPVGNGIIKVEYKDTSDATAPFEPYTIRVVLDCELKEN